MNGAGGVIGARVTATREISSIFYGRCYIHELGLTSTLSSHPHARPDARRRAAGPARIGRDGPETRDPTAPTDARRTPRRGAARCVALHFPTARWPTARSGSTVRPSARRAACGPWAHVTARSTPGWLGGRARIFLRRAHARSRLRQHATQRGRLPSKVQCARRSRSCERSSSRAVA